MAVNKVVVHHKDGRIMKGTTIDFFPQGSVFRLTAGEISDGPTQEILVDGCKAVFFVKSLMGCEGYDEIKDFAEPVQSGKRIKAVFDDGEAMYGYTHALNFDYPGFFLFPADPNANNDRVFIVFSSLAELEMNDTPLDLAAARRG